MRTSIAALPITIAILGATLRTQDPTSEVLVDFNRRIHNEIMKYGYPGTAEIRYRRTYVVSHDNRNKTAHWVCERLNSSRLRKRVSRKDNFKPDKSIAEEHRAEKSDYRGSGFDRGHLAPAADAPRSRRDMDATFLLSNMSAQVGVGFNRHYWKGLEKKIRDWAKASDNLYVITGPLYTPADFESGRLVQYRVIGDNDVAVPTHFFKVMLREIDDEIEMLALVLPNETIDSSTDLTEFIRSVDDVERTSGLDFWRALDDEDEDELERAPGALFAD